MCRTYALVIFKLSLKTVYNVSDLIILKDYIQKCLANEWKMKLTYI